MWPLLSILTVCLAPIPLMDDELAVIELVWLPTVVDKVVTSDATDVIELPCEVTVDVKADTALEVALMSVSAFVRSVCKVVTSDATDVIVLPCEVTVDVKADTALELAVMDPLALVRPV